MEKARLSGELAKTKELLEASQEAAARTGAALRASEARCNALETEVSCKVVGAVGAAGPRGLRIPRQGFWSVGAAAKR